VDRTGDLGTVVDYIETMVDLLGGAFTTFSELMDAPYDGQRRIWVPPETLRFRDEV